MVALANLISSYSLLSTPYSPIPVIPEAETNTWLNWTQVQRHLGQGRIQHAVLGEPFWGGRDEVVGLDAISHLRQNLAVTQFLAEASTASTLDEIAR